jgi:hypothetical protein
MVQAQAFGGRQNAYDVVRRIQPIRAQAVDNELASYVLISILHFRVYFLVSENPGANFGNVLKCVPRLAWVLCLQRSAFRSFKPSRIMT